MEVRLGRWVSGGLSILLWDWTLRFHAVGRCQRRRRPAAGKLTPFGGSWGQSRWVKSRDNWGYDMASRGYLATY